MLLIREMQIKSAMRYRLTPVSTATMKKKKKKTLSPGQDVKKLEPLSTVCGDAIWCSQHETQYEGFSKTKERNYRMIQQSPFWVFIKNNLNQDFRDISILIFIAAIFIIAKMWKQFKYSRKDEWMDKMQYIHIRKYYSDFQKKKILGYVTTWLIRKDIVLSEIDQYQKIKYCIIFLS